MKAVFLGIIVLMLTKVDAFALPRNDAVPAFSKQVVTSRPAPQVRLPSAGMIRQYVHSLFVAERVAAAKANQVEKEVGQLKKLIRNLQLRRRMKAKSLRRLRQVAKGYGLKCRRVRPCVRALLRAQAAVLGEYAKSLIRIQGTAVLIDGMSGKKTLTRQLKEQVARIKRVRRNQASLLKTAKSLE